jgi:hypothetical protein
VLESAEFPPGAWSPTGDIEVSAQPRAGDEYGPRTQVLRVLLVVHGLNSVRGTREAGPETWVQYFEWATDPRTGGGKKVPSQKDGEGARVATARATDPRTGGGGEAAGNRGDVVEKREGHASPAP